MRSRQLPLALDRRAPSSFDSFWPGPNEAVLRALRAVAERPAGRWVALSGPAGSGKSHLLASTARAVPGASRLAGRYLRATAAPEDLADFEALPLLCIDDVDALIGGDDRGWEAALFRLFDGQRRSGKGLVFAARQGPRELAPRLPDLASRLRWGEHWRLATLGDGAKAELLRARAEALGIALDDRTIASMLSRLPRDVGALLAGLAAVAEASLASQRRVSPQLVQAVIRDGSARAAWAGEP